MIRSILCVLGHIVRMVYYTFEMLVLIVISKVKESK
jgi:hypothetical protein